MQRLRELLAHGGIAILAVVFALALAAFNLATAFAREVISVLQQHTFDEESGSSLTVTIAGTEIFYGEALLHAITLALVVLALFAAWLLTRRGTRFCPECRASVPVSASICRFCTTDLQPNPADA